MNLFLAIPFPLRLAITFVLGALAGRLANLVIANLTTRRVRRDSYWLHWIPIAGAPWIRPFVIELATAIGFAALYAWEVDSLGLLIPPWPLNIPASTALIETIHWQHVSHISLLWFLIVASVIDIDYKIIPDQVTVPGTLIGLALAALVPWSLLPDVNAPAAGAVPTVDFLKLTSPLVWAAWLDGAPRLGSLAIAMGCYLGWCFALLPRPWRARRGRRFAVRILLARMGRALATPLVLAIIILGIVGISAVWWWGGDHWKGLLTALVGMAASGGLVWAVRLVGTAALKREAMGFGDVTLMAMIGTFLGWQPCIIVFFLSPPAALVIGITKWVLHRDNELPYGPYLSLATVALIVWWAPIWSYARDIYALGLIVPLIIVICIAVMPLLLWAMRVVGSMFSRS